MFPRKYGRQKIWKTNIKFVIKYSNVHLYLIFVNLENFRFSEQIFHKNMNDKNFEKINIEFETSMYKSTPLRNFSQFEEMRIMRPNLLKNHERQKIWKQKNINCNNHVTMYSCTKTQLIWTTSGFVGPNLPPEVCKIKILKKINIKFEMRI